MTHFDGRTVIVTGGASGIGAATARLFADRGAAVIIGDLADPTSIVDEIRGAGGRAEAVQGDITADGQPERLVQTALDRYGRLDVLVNNAGFARPGRVDQMPEADWRAIWEVNVHAGFRCCRVAIPAIAESGGGSVLFTSSTGALRQASMFSAYFASKAAILTLVRCMALDHGPQGIRVNAVCPGGIDTPMFRMGMAHAGTDAEHYAATLPMGRILDPSEVAEAFAFLASDAARNITGQHFAVDGGSSAGDFFPVPPQGDRA